MALYSFRTHPLESEKDWWRVRQLLIETHPITGPEFNWEIRHWDGDRCLRNGPPWLPANGQKYCLWETGEGDLAGMTHFEGDDELCIQVHPRYRQAIEDEMMAWGESQIAQKTVTGKRQIQQNVFEYDAPRLRLIKKRGYVKTTEGWVVRLLHLVNQPLPEPVIAPGYHMRTTYPFGHAEFRSDCEKMAAVLNAGFNRPGFHTADEYAILVTQSPSFDNDLNLVMVAPDGSFASHAGMTYDEDNHFAVFEPVCTNPEHRRKGLAQALMFEALKRLQPRGTVCVEVATGHAEAANALYNSIGFTEVYEGYYWVKELP